MGESIEKQLSKALSEHAAQQHGLEGKNFDPLEPRGEVQKAQPSAAEDVEKQLQEQLQGIETTPAAAQPAASQDTATTNTNSKDSEFTGAHVDLHEQLEDIVGNKLRARPFFKKHSLEFLERLIEIASEQLDIKREERKAEEAENAKRMAALEKMQAIAEEVGLSLEDVIGATVPAAPKKKRTYMTKKRREALEAQQAAEANGEGTTQANEPAPEPAKAPAKKNSSHVHIAKYKCHMYGRDYYWAGRGNPINVFKAYMSKGYTKEDCLMPESEWFVCKEHPEKMDLTIPPEFMQQHKDALAKYARDSKTT